MFLRIFISICFVVFSFPAFALEPNEILVIANRNLPMSLEVAEHYCKSRNVPTDRIIALELGALSDRISRDNYNKLIAAPLRDRIYNRNLFGEIRCLVTVYGVPFRVLGTGTLAKDQPRLKALQRLREEVERNTETAKALGQTQQVQENQKLLARLKLQIDMLSGKETDASVDSELSLLLAGEYNLYRWQPNGLKGADRWDYTTLMVSRLDGPSPEIAKGLVDKSLHAEQHGLRGKVYIDTRGIAAGVEQGKGGFREYDLSLSKMAGLYRGRVRMEVEVESTAALFEPNECPQTAIYCGWYSLQKYVDAFEFVDGAIGYHIASWEAVHLRDPNSSEWCPAMLMDGVTATIGAVAEPYLNAFPLPSDFFRELNNGLSLAEAYYKTKPFNSWQLMLIGDPLYTPFPKKNRGLILPLGSY